MGSGLQFLFDNYSVGLIASGKVCDGEFSNQSTGLRSTDQEGLQN